MRTVITAASLFLVLAAITTIHAQDSLDELERLIEELPPESEPAAAETPAAPERLGAVRAPAYLGVTIEDRRVDRRALILSVRPDGPAARAGIRADDVIVAMGDRDTTTLGAFQSAMNSFSAGERIAVQVMRGGRLFEFQVTMGARDGRLAPPVASDRITANFPPPPPADETPSVVLGRPVLGIQIGPLHTQNYRLLGISTNWGVVVEDVLPNSPAQRHGVPRGAIIVGLNGLRVEHVHDMMAMMARLPPDRPVELTYVVGGRTYRNTIPLEPLARRGTADRAPLDLPEPPDTELPDVETPDVESIVPTTPPPPESEPPPVEEPTPAAPEAEIRLPTTTAKVPADAARVKAMQEELKMLRERAEALEAALDDLRAADKEE